VVGRTFSLEDTAILEARDRSAAGATAAASGLYLVQWSIEVCSAGASPENS